ncbi:MAG: hypothetical protein AB7P76_02995 [Candidatus Melainabacteria bacterium]
MTTLLQVLGPHGAGKTTLMPGLAMALSWLLAAQEFQMLLLDAAVDQGLSRTALGMGNGAAPEVAPKTLTHLAQTLMEKPMDDDAARREYIDWAFHDLPAPMPADWLGAYCPGDQTPPGVEVMALGPLRERLPERLWQGLVYGLQRVVGNHDLVLIDEDHPLVRACFQKQGNLCSMLVATPQQDPATWPLLPEGETLPLVINRFDGNPLHPGIVQGIEDGRLKLVGKLPVYGNQDAMQDQLVNDWRDILLRLNITLHSY